MRASWSGARVNKNVFVRPADRLFSISSLRSRAKGCVVNEIRRSKT